MQNFASAGAGVSQDGQRRSWAAPQDMQNRASAGFSVPQELHGLEAISNKGTASPARISVTLAT